MGSNGSTTRAAMSVAGRTFVFLALAIFGLLIVGAVAPDELLVVGDQGPAAALIEHDFGPDAMRPGTGFDGQQVYAIARAFPHLDDAAPHLAPPRYRLLRIVQPAIASLGGSGTPVVVLLVLTGLVGCALFAGAVAELAPGAGLPHWAAYLAVVPLVPCVLVSTNEPLAAGLAFLAVALAHRRRYVWAVLAMCIAALTRETSLLVAMGAAVGLWSVHRRAALSIALFPAAVLGAWATWLAHVIGGDLPARLAFLDWTRLDGPTSALLAVTFAACAVGAIAWRRSPLMWPTAALTGLSTLLLTREVYGEISPWFGVPRLAAPVIGLGLTAFARSRAARPAHSIGRVDAHEIASPGVALVRATIRN